MVDHQERGWISNEAERERAEEIREKEHRGEKLTQKEKGQLGAYESRRSTRHDPESEHKVASWMAGEDTRKPHLSEETRSEVERIKAKEERGETLTRHEAGMLGGAKRAKKG
ncbi:MAG: hypothetical protein QOE90_3654 [Thermoplasmata archaeon]|jgi:hypothetical protein|nr:hypothetical protein [Thermoplasmata archaeon]